MAINQPFGISAETESSWEESLGAIDAAFLRVFVAEEEAREAAVTDAFLERAPIIKTSALGESVALLFFDPDLLFYFLQSRVDLFHRFIQRVGELARPVL
jgi:hypothetical protein